MWSIVDAECEQALNKNLLHINMTKPKGQRFYDQYLANVHH